MPPTSTKQQRFIWMEAKRGVPWAVKYLKDAPTMQVVKPGEKTPPEKHKYDKEKAEIVKRALRKHGRR